MPDLSLCKVVEEELFEPQHSHSEQPEALAFFKKLVWHPFEGSPLLLVKMASLKLKMKLDA